MTTDELKKLLRAKPSGESKVSVKNRNLLSFGSTLLDLACSDRVAGGILKGKVILFVGDSSSGKTWLTLTSLAEAAMNKNFDDYRFIYDNAEDGALMDIERFFGKKVLERLEPPARDEDGDPVYSESIEELYDHLDDAVKVGKPFIYIEDSMDSLTSEAEDEKFQEQKSARRRGKESSGSYGDGKAKKNSAGIRRLLPHLRRTNSIFIIISQTRDNLGFGFEKKTRSGGRALRFYATLELWSSIKKKIKKKLPNGKIIQLGIVSEVQIKKNRLTGKERKVEVPIYYSHGIDNVGSCVEFLIREKRWPKTGSKVKARDFDFIGPVPKLIRHIENEGLEKELRSIVAEVWTEIEEAAVVKRKRRYE